MPEIARLSGSRDWIDLDFVERERTPERAMKLGIQMHVAGLSLSDTISVLDNLGVQRSRKAVHDWVQKADLQPASGKSPNQIAVDETVIRINDQQFWLYAAANPQTNKILHLRLFSTTTTALTEIFLKELRQKHDVETAVFLVDGAKHLQAALQRAGLRFQMPCLITRQRRDRDTQTRFHSVNGTISGPDDAVAVATGAWRIIRTMAFCSHGQVTTAMPLLDTSGKGEQAASPNSPPALGYARCTCV